MALQTLDLCRKESGKIWQRKPVPSTDDGVMVHITHSVSSPLALQSRNIRFLHVAFDTTGDRFVAGDYQGNMFVFDLSRNRYSLVQRTGTPCSSLAFTLKRRTEFLVGMSDYSLKCYDIDTKELVAWMKGHESPIHTISIHASGRYALTSSNDTAQLWDLDTFQRKRKLNIKENVGIVKVFFLPLSNTIMTCFKDDSIFAWEADTLNCKYQLPIPPGNTPHYKAFAATKDGRLLVAGGKSRFLHVWTLDTRRLLRIIQLPAKVTSVKEMEFLPDKFDAGSSQVLGVLSQDGIMRFIHIHTCKLLFDLGSVGDRINTMAMSPTGHHVVGVMEDGNLNIYSVQALTAELNKPPPPLVSVVSSQRKQETGDVTSSSQADVTQGKRASRLKRKARLAQGSEVSAVDVKPKKTSHEQVGLPEGLNMDKLMAILRGYGEYPAKYRMFIWRSILRLPENHAAYASLVDKGTHPAYENIHEKFPIKSRKLLRVLQRTLSALSHWSAIFGEMDYLPLLTFPFVKLFQNNQLVLFEIIATVLVNWCQHWFEFFPNPPINVLGMVENVLAFHDKELLQHFVKYGVTSQIYAWPVLETLFSEVLTKDEWLRLFDNVLSNHPAFLLMCVVAYCTACRGPLLQCIEFDDFKYFFHHRNAVDIGDVIKEAYRIQETTPPDVHPERMLDTFQPLTRGQYPVFNKYPKFIVDYQVQERERIREEELEYLRQRQVSLELQKETERRQQEEAAWYRQQELLLEAEEKRRKMISEEEEKLYEQRSRLQAMNREVKMKEMKLLDATRRKYMNYQQKQRTSEIKRLDDEIQRKAAMREMETQHAVQEAEIKNLELQLQKKMFEQELYREHAETTQKLRSEYDAFRKRQEIEDRGQHRVNLAEREREQEIRRRLQQNLAHAEHVTTDAETRKQMEYRQELDNLDREMQNVQLAKLQNENRDLEKEVHKLMNELKTRREEEAIETLEELQAQRRQADVAAERRTRLLREESGLAEDHLEQLGNTLDQSFERLRDLRQRATDNRDQSCLNEVSTGTDGTTTLSFDRTGRTSLDEGEAMLMQEVRRLREKLASDSRTKKPPAEF